jgi:hypothetical protein
MEIKVNGSNESRPQLLVCPAWVGPQTGRIVANAKPRVHEIASELGVDSKVALAKLKDSANSSRSPSSTIEPPVARKLRAALEADGAGSRQLR